VALRLLRLGEEKKKEREKKQEKNIMSASAMQGGHNKCDKEDSVVKDIKWHFYYLRALGWNSSTYNSS